MSLARSAASRLEQLDQIAGGILEQDLRPAGPGHDLVAEVDPGGAQPRRLTDLPPSFAGFARGTDALSRCERRFARVAG